MELKSLDAVRRLRQQVVDGASLNLAERIEGETAASTAVRRLAEEIDHQRKAVETARASDQDVETFGAWLRQARARLHQLSGEYERHAVETARARAELATARTALEAVETLVKKAETAIKIAALRAEQNVLDEIAARPPTNWMDR